MVCFANGAGGRLLIGIEDGQALPPPDQRVAPELLARLRKRIGELTVNVQALPRLQRAANGGEFIELLIDHWLRGVQLDHKTTLSRIAPHRLQALILEDLARYPDSSTPDVNRRIGAEISAKTVKRALDELEAAGRVSHFGERRWRRYRVSAQEHQG